ncbi:L-histidine N(alpha)-methyltransferase [Streptomyces sp. NBC_01497]|uniref:L-histidine N(alpha)-methyltransferase n=1 Tax=Streptomyces sp. NBC_01497 TaxID=2903885 RepID=UPI002E30E144|nr:L-histidine N(alpha)-methyltransferase [Streptomyces sp. NBC_01497]
MSVHAPSINPAFLADVRDGLLARPKFLSPTWLYDTAGSRLFEEITRLPEYYPTSAETEILTAHSSDIARRTQPTTLVELGSGSSTKTRLLIDAARAAGHLARYVPVDVSEDALIDAARALKSDYPNLSIEPKIDDFTGPFPLPAASRRVIAFLGGTFGNLLPDARHRFLTSLRAQMSAGDTLLLGADLVKESAVIVRAYDDAAGITAAFNVNVLVRLNRELGCDFDIPAFQHIAHWDVEHEWIEMRLRSLKAQTVRVPALGLTVAFDADEELRTEISAKFRPARLAAELSAAGLPVQGWWTDHATRYGVALAGLHV